MFQHHMDFARQLVKDESTRIDGIRISPDNSSKVILSASDQKLTCLELMPFAAEKKPVDAKHFFSTVKNVNELLNAYTQARTTKLFEEELAHACDYVSDYATEFLNRIFIDAQQNISNEDARRIAQLVSTLDVYAAIKAVESLLNSHADLTLLKIAETQGWTLIFDHLAIRCGCSERGDAERVVKNLCSHHDYVPCQINSENYFLFEDGWDAYVLYKVLENGQQIRLFIDQSSDEKSAQIIQHWNHVYGYTAHHLALRATQFINDQRTEVSLAELVSAMKNSDIQVMTPTGQYTSGLLEQVFTRSLSEN